MIPVRESADYYLAKPTFSSPSLRCLFMSSFNSPNPFGEPNPYSSPVGGGPPGFNYEAARGKVLPPAIALIVVGGLGLMLSLINVAIALNGKPVGPIDPNAPEFVRQ